MSSANIPQIYDQNMGRLAMLDKAINIGYRQVYNDLWTATFTLPADDPKNEYCQPFNYVEIYDEKRRIELFRIVKSSLSRSDKGFIVYSCEHVISTLLDNVLFLFHQIGNLGVYTHEVINYVLSFQSVQRWILGRCDFSRQFLYKWESDNLLSALFSIPRPFDDEWHFTYDTTVYPWVLNLVRSETEIGCEIRRRKNMQEIQKETDATRLVTRILPLGYGEGDNQLTIESVNNGLHYLDADTIPIYGLKETIWTDRRFENAENMKATAMQMLNKLKTPYISYTVSSIDLFKHTGQDFDEFREGKMVRVIDRHDGIDIDTRIVEIEKSDVTTADISVVLANKDRNIAGSIAALQDRAKINDTYAQGAETLLMIPFIDNADQNFPAVFEFFIPAGMVNVNEAILRVQLQPFRAYSRAIKGGGGTTQTSTSGGGVSTSTAAGGATTQTTTQQAQQTPTTSTTAQQTPTTSTTSTQTPTTSSGGSTSTTSGSGGGTSTTSGSGGGTTASSSQDSTVEMWLTGGPFGPNDFMSRSGDPPHAHGLVRHQHDHSHSVTIQNHTHSISIQEHTHNITIGAHSHNVTIPGHSHTVTIPGHSHTVTIPGHSHTVTIPAHGHNVTIPSHTHNVTIPAHTHSTTLPNHTHEIEFGIFTGSRADSISIRVDNNVIPITTDLNSIDIIPFLRRDGGGRIVRNSWHKLEIIPNSLTRLSACIFLNIFTNSRGGENY